MEVCAWSVPLACADSLGARWAPVRERGAAVQSEVSSLRYSRRRTTRFNVPEIDCAFFLTGSRIQIGKVGIRV